LIEVEHLPPELRPKEAGETPAEPVMNLEAMERVAIARALQRCGGNRKRTARQLGINVSTLYRKIRSLGIEPPPKDGRGREG
ncbi:MAG: helix-turn-helix domain-containing protein, partial [Verrucomicrobiota bacterium]